MEEELVRLEEQNIIEISVCQTIWVSPLFIIPKPNKPETIRICVEKQ